jgi:hypothetical protein
MPDKPRRAPSRSLRASKASQVALGWGIGKQDHPKHIHSFRAMLALRAIKNQPPFALRAEH